MKLWSWIVVLCFLLQGCTGSMHKKQELVVQGVSIGGISGLSILVEAGVWVGNPQVEQRITPVKITIYNKSGKLLGIQYSNFCIRGKGSNSFYAAMPPYEIRGTVKNPSIVLPYPFPVKSEIEYNQKFQVVHYCARMYPGIPACEMNLLLDLDYYTRYYSRYARIRLPEVEMLSKLIPEGVLGNEGYVSGYLYFEKIASKEKQMEFCVDLFDAQKSILIGSVRIPFCVTKK